MSARPSSPPPSADAPAGAAEPPEEARRTLERILPELIRRGFEAGRGPFEKVSESFFPRDLASQLVSQLGDIRTGIVKGVAQEVGRFLREADIASELRKVLVGLNVEAHVKLRFSARDDGGLKSEIDMTLGQQDKPDKPNKSGGENKPKK